MTRLGTRPQAAPLRHASDTIAKGLGALAVVVVLLVTTWLLTPPTLVPKLTVVNPGEYQVNVELTGPGHEGWSDLGTVDRDAAKTVEQILDPGREWVFRFSYGSVPAGELIVARSTLTTDGWEVTVPPEVMDRLRAAGLQPSSR